MCTVENFPIGHRGTPRDLTHKKVQVSGKLSTSLLMRELTDQRARAMRHENAEIKLMGGNGYTLDYQLFPVHKRSVSPDSILCRSFHPTDNRYINTPKSHLSSCLIHPLCGKEEHFETVYVDKNKIEIRSKQRRQFTFVLSTAHGMLTRGGKK